jgi:hypothetical protein
MRATTQYFLGQNLPVTSLISIVPLHPAISAENNKCKYYLPYGMQTLYSATQLQFAVQLPIWIVQDIREYAPIEWP